MRRGKELNLRYCECAIVISKTKVRESENSRNRNRNRLPKLIQIDYFHLFAFSVACEMT